MLRKGSAGTSGVRIVTRQYLFDLMKIENLLNLDAKLNFLKDKLLSCEGYNEDQIVSLKRGFAHFKSEIKQRWAKAHYKEYTTGLGWKLVCGDNNEKVLWNNPTPSSPRFCRPIRFQFIKETNDVTEEEIRHVKSAIRNTNDGNISRRFFENPKLAAEITGINYELIYRLKVILEEISSGFKIDPVKYERYALETARIYVNLYDWHPMTPTMHKILVHGAVIIEKALLPIG
ncbi:unnamed protein product [Colias eurytheme]|nr:unnamed protein product [Colias eurytheme]